LSGEEFGYEALIMEYDNRSWFRAGRLLHEGDTFNLPDRYEWLLEETSWRSWSDASYDTVKMFNPGEPVVLLHLERTIHDRDPDPATFASEGGTPVGERLVIWLDVRAPVATTPGLTAGAPSSEAL
jgi:hypothetical protein